MGEKRMSMIERLPHRIEDHVEEWREQDRARKAELEVHRAELWAEAAERQKLLAEAITEQETQPASIEEITKQHRVDQRLVAGVRDSRIEEAFSPEVGPSRVELVPCNDADVRKATNGGASV